MQIPLKLTDNIDIPIYDKNRDKKHIDMFNNYYFNGIFEDWIHSNQKSKIIIYILELFL